MILGLLLKPFSIAADVILAFIPKKLLLLLIITLVLAVYYGYTYEF
jgi:hypothetical protein|tara:strand:+ start:282 stop:419 length:138 start_codon:yes stop_codon:yes gene_type:complete